MDFVLSPQMQTRTDRPRPTGVVERVHLASTASALPTSTPVSDQLPRAGSVEAAIDWLGRVPRRLPDFWASPPPLPVSCLRVGQDAFCGRAGDVGPHLAGLRVLCLVSFSRGCGPHSPGLLGASLVRTRRSCAHRPCTRGADTMLPLPRSLLSSPPQAGWAEVHDQRGALLMVPLLAEVEHTDPLAGSSSPACGPAPSGSWRVGPSGIESPSGRALVPTPAHSTGGAGTGREGSPVEQLRTFQDV